MLRRSLVIVHGVYHSRLYALLSTSSAGSLKHGVKASLFTRMISELCADWNQAHVTFNRSTDARIQCRPTDDLKASQIIALNAHFEPMLTRATRLPLMLRHRRVPSPTVLPARLPPDAIVEEENVPEYNAQRFYPAKLGEVLDQRYQLALKLGYGVGSTVWLARDLNRSFWQPTRYVAVKIGVTPDPMDTSRTDTARNELSILSMIEDAKTQHQGSRFVRKLVDSFSLAARNQMEHQCMVFEPMREPLHIYQRRYPSHAISSHIMKILVRQILYGLDFLHSTCRIIHTDLKPDNIMVEPEDQDIFEKEVLRERDEPRPQKIAPDGRTIYVSRGDFGAPEKVTGLIQITDFGYAVQSEAVQQGGIQAEVYRAPEVMLGAGYSHSADIWNLGVMIWDLLQGQPLFHAAEAPDLDHQHDEGYHIGLMTALLGEAPEALLKRSTRKSRYYNEDGLQDDILVPADFNWESTITTIEGKDKELFIAFAKRMITWLPEDRATAKELLEDPWLKYKEQHA